MHNVLVNQCRPCRHQNTTDNIPSDGLLRAQPAELWTGQFTRRLGVSPWAGKNSTLSKMQNTHKSEGKENSQEGTPWVPVVLCSLLLLTQTAILLSSSLFLCLDSCECGAGVLQGHRWTSQQQPSSHRFDPYQQVLSTKSVLVWNSTFVFLNTSNGEYVNYFFVFLFIGVKTVGIGENLLRLANSQKTKV